MDFILKSLAIACISGLIIGYIIAITISNQNKPNSSISYILTLIILVIPVIFIFFNVSFILQSATDKPVEAHSLASSYALISSLIVIFAAISILIGIERQKLAVTIVPLIMFFLYYRLPLPILIKIQTYNELAVLDNISMIWLLILCVWASSLLFGYLLTMRLKSVKSFA